MSRWTVKRSKLTPYSEITFFAPQAKFFCPEGLTDLNFAKNTSPMHYSTVSLLAICESLLHVIYIILNPRRWVEQLACGRVPIRLAEGIALGNYSGACR